MKIDMLLKEKVKKIVGVKAVSFYHYLVAQMAAFYYGFPSKNLITIGVVGTKGKTSTVNFLWSCLQQSGLKTGMLSTANIRVGEQEALNEYHMTMPSPFIIQRHLKQMLKNGCVCAIVEATSEGIKQWRHKGIDFDFLIFTNLSPEHLPSHNYSFEKYRQTKGKIFASLKNYPDKYLAGRYIKKTIIVNIDDPHSYYFLGFSAERKITFGIYNPADYQATDLQNKEGKLSFAVNGKTYHLNVIGDFNVYNALPAIALCDLLGNIDYEQVKAGLFNVCSLPGRMEVIEGGQKFLVLVDYAHEPKSMELALKNALVLRKPNGKLIVLLGAEGGGRDKTKRPKMGEIAAKLADIVVISNVDPYDDNPAEIIEEIAQAAEKNNKTRGRDLFLIEDRRAGIQKCLAMAKEGDVVLITGKGAEQSMIIKGKKIPWDDRCVVKEELEKLSSLT
jgi:UDP-N-acetylmuramoyl-L-alanyl-D-glutamate--2,6-diaminopimelate ligase